MKRTSRTFDVRIGSFLLLSTLGLSQSVADAAVRLTDVNCASGGGQRCTFSSSNAGKIGSGLPFKLGGFETIGSGYVDAATNSVLVPLEFGGQQDNQGVVMRVDLATGNRTVVSGYDGEEMHGHGVAYTSDRNEQREAYDLGRVMVVRPGPNGTILALVDKGLQERTEIISIDPKTGNRTLVWASKVFNDAAPSGPASIRDIEAQRFNMSSASLCQGGGKVALKPASVFEADSQNIYMMLVNNPGGTGIGVVKVPLRGGACTWVSEYQADGSSQVGSGPTVNTLSPLVFGSALIGSEFVAATGPNPSGNVLFGVDTRSGARRTISATNVQTPARNKGDGPALGYLGTLAAGQTGVATARPAADSEYAEPVLVNVASGKRTQLTPKAGSLKSGRDGYYGIVAAIPGTSKFVVAFGKALHVWDSQTGNSYVLSQ